MLNGKTLEFVSKINQAANLNDFVALGTNQVYVKVYEGQFLKNFFTTDTERTLDEAAAEFRKAVNALEPTSKELSLRLVQEPNSVACSSISEGSQQTQGPFAT
ncbi:hypothetical protein ACA910_022537 [Epithemia clementina (nom. ined.)]